VNGYVELGYLVVLGSLAVYSVSLATRHRRAAQTVRVVEAARLVAAAGAAGHGPADAAGSGSGPACAAAPPEAPAVGEASAGPVAASSASDPRAGSDLSTPTNLSSTAATGERE